MTADFLSGNSSSPESGTQELPIALIQHTARLPAHDISSLLSPSPTAMIMDHLAEELPKESLLPIQLVPESPEPLLIDEPKPLSQSMLWKIQEDYYANQGIDAWDHSVPFYITNSAFIAESYAEMIVAFLKDAYHKLDPQEPIYIVEMASGSGRFGFHLLSELSRKLPCFAKLRDLNIKVVMTDFTENNIEYWEHHEKFAPFIESGMLDFAVFRPEEFETLDLRVSGVHVSKDTVKNPVVAMANYFFDTIRQDLFGIESKQLFEGQVALLHKSPDEPVHIKHVETKTTFRPLYNDNYYSEPRWNAVLKYYRHNNKKGSFLFPIGAFHCLRNLEALSNHNLVLLSSDKAFTKMEEMVSCPEHPYAIHDGAFSYMVNYHAIGRHFENSGGRYFFTTSHDVSLHTVCCIMLNERPGESRSEFEHVDYLFREKIDRCNPINSLYQEEGFLNEASKILGAPMDALLGFVRLTLCDPHAFVQCGQKILDAIPRMTYNQRQDLIWMLEETWSRYYFFKGEVNLPFWIAQVYYFLGMHDKAIAFFETTIELFGEHDALSFLIAQCHEAMNNKAMAKSHYQRALELRPDFEEAKMALSKL